jgi:hypothetical protein
MLKMAVFWAMDRPDDGRNKNLETSVNIYRVTRRNIPEDSHLHTYRCENLKSHFCEVIYLLVLV